MPNHPYIKVPQTFLPHREITPDLTPAEFLNWYYSLCNIISVVESDIQTIMHFRGWQAYRASSGPHCVMRKTFPNGRVVARDLGQDRDGNQGRGLLPSGGADCGNSGSAASADPASPLPPVLAKAFLTAHPLEWRSKSGMSYRAVQIIVLIIVPAPSQAA